MKLLTIAASFIATYSYAGIVAAEVECGSKIGQTPCFMTVPEPSIIGLISLGVVAVFVASRLRK